MKIDRAIRCANLRRSLAKDEQPGREDLGQGRFLKSRNQRIFVGEKKEEEEKKRMS